LRHRTIDRIARRSIARTGFAALGAAVLLTSVHASAHHTSPTSTLRSLVAEADLVVHARVLGSEDLVVDKGGARKRRPALRVELIEVMKGPALAGQTLRLAQHGHGVAEYHAGQDALLFLRALDRSAELSSLGSATALRWYSGQEQDDAYALSARSRPPTLAAARAYAALEPLPPSERAEALRRITLKLLASRDRRLAVSALRDLTRAGVAIPLTAQDLPNLIMVVDDSNATIEIRLGLLAELERRGLLDGGTRWARLLQTSQGNERNVVIRAVAAHPGPLVDAELLKILASTDALAASEAAISLGYAGNEAAVQPLANTLNSKNPRRRMAAIRGLGGIGSADARAVLSSVAASHPDQATRRRANAELARLEREAP
jgi:HEAT repeats